MIDDDTPDTASDVPSADYREFADGTQASGRPRARRAAALVVAGALFASGFGVGRWTADEDEPTLPQAAAPAATPSPVSAPPPSAGREPVAAVAAALQPSVVQLETAGGLGSGVIYDAAGYILTAAHVVSGQDTVIVRLSDGSSREGEVLGEDPYTDIAVVKVEADGLQPADLAVGVPVQVGQLAVAIGSPFGLDQSVTAGIISAVHRPVTHADPIEEEPIIQDMLQTDAPINPGNSGGALADRRGRVIGINDAIRTSSGGNQGVGFAVPIDVAAWVADRIVSGEEVTRAFLGVGGTEATDGRGGALITSVEGGSAADRAGLEEGDLITAFQGSFIDTMADLAARVRSTPPGTTVRLTVERGGRLFTVEAELGTGS